MSITVPQWLPPLRELLSVVCAPPPGAQGLRRLMTSLTEVETLLAQNRAEMPSELVHFLDAAVMTKPDNFARATWPYCAGLVVQDID